MVLWGRCILSGLFFDKNFALSIGPQRAGARWIDRYLRGRGDVCLPTHVKEIFYFDRHFERGPEFYFGHFRYLPQHKIGVEVTTTAFDHPEAPARVHQMFRDILDATEGSRPRKNKLFHFTVRTFGPGWETLQ